MTELLGSVRTAIEEHRLLDHGDSVVVGVSGGPDSLCLLHVLCRLGQEFDLTVHVAHLNHGLRGSDADADAGFVRALAADWDLACTVERADVPLLANEHRLAVEEAARRARYAFLGRVAREQGAGAIAVGHNADDQAETVLMHWLRGSGLAGLRGMLASTPLGDYRLLDLADPKPANLDERLVRPLLSVTRAEIEAYCHDHGLQPRFDRSNLDTTYFRNWLRLTVIPLLARHNPNVQDVIRRSARVIADEYALLRNLLEDTWPAVVLEEGAKRIVFDLAEWRGLAVALQRSTLREAVHRLRSTLRDINFVHIENALRVARDGNTGAQATLPRHLMLTVTDDGVVIAGNEDGAAAPNWPLLELGSAPLPVSVPGETPIPGSTWRLEATLVPRQEWIPQWDRDQDPWFELCDAEVAGAELWLRVRRPGDRFQPLGMGGSTVKLADYFTNQKVPRALRDRLPLLVNQRQILWVCGHRLDNRARVREVTGQILRLRWARGSSS